MTRKNRFLPFLALVVFAIGAQAQDAQHCSNATLHGSYGFHATGTGFVAIGRFVFDGNGALTGKLFVRVPGTNIGRPRICRNLFGKPRLHGYGQLARQHACFRNR